MLVRVLLQVDPPEGASGAGAGGHQGAHHLPSDLAAIDNLGAVQAILRTVKRADDKEGGPYTEVREANGGGGTSPYGMPG